MKDDRSRISRREFTALTLAAGVSAATGAAAQPDMTDADVNVGTAAGTCDAALVHPRGPGPWPAAILFPDIFGLRPTMRNMAKRLAANGYVVLVPNPFYRSTRAPGLSLDFDFASAADRAKLDAFRAPMTSDAVMQDAASYVAFLDAQPVVDKRAKIGVFGYCMGGPMTMQAAAASPQRIGAGASFHGGGLVTDKPDSPHLLIPRIKARFYFGIAANDDAKQPQAKNRLTEGFRATAVPATVEVYPGTLHGWCVADMPLQDGKPIYDEPQAERAWHELIALFQRAKA